MREVFSQRYTVTSRVLEDGKVRIFVWDSQKRPDWMGRIFPTKDVILSRKKSNRRVRLHGGTLELTIDASQHLSTRFE